MGVTAEPQRQDPNLPDRGKKKEKKMERKFFPLQKENENQ